MDKDIKINIDSGDIDRLAVGSRLYDMIDMHNRARKCKIQDIKHSFKENRDSKFVITIGKQLIKEMIELVNKRGAYQNDEIVIEID